MSFSKDPHDGIMPLGYIVGVRSATGVIEPKLSAFKQAEIGSVEQLLSG